MHSPHTKSDTELQIPKKKIKLVSQEASVKESKKKLLTQILLKETEREIGLRKEDLELIEDNIFSIRQKLLQLKQVIADDYYRQKSEQAFLQYPPHPAVKDSFVGKSPVGYKNCKPNPEECKTNKTVQINSNDKADLKLVNKRKDVDVTEAGDSKKLLDNNKLPCYIAPKILDNNVVQPIEPRDVYSKKEIRIIVGNVSKWLAPSETYDATHKWTVYAKIADPNLDISLFVNKVVFFLHKSYRPNDVIEIKYPPFKLTRRGWGEFPLKAQLHFKNSSDPPIDVKHYLKLDNLHTGFETFGAETSLTVWAHLPSECETQRKCPESVAVKNKSNILNEPTTVVKCETENNHLTKLEESPVNYFENTNILNEIFSNNFFGDDYFLKNEDFGFHPDLPSGSAPTAAALLEEIKCDNLFPPLSHDALTIHQNHVKENFQESNICSNETKFDEIDELFTDECNVVGEEVVIDCGEPSDFIKSEPNDSNKSDPNVFFKCEPEEQIIETNFESHLKPNSPSLRNDNFTFNTTCLNHFIKSEPEEQIIGTDSENLMEPDKPSLRNNNFTLNTTFNSINLQQSSNFISQVPSNLFNEHCDGKSTVDVSLNNTVLGLVKKDVIKQSGTKVVPDKCISKFEKVITINEVSAVNFGQKLSNCINKSKSSDKTLKTTCSTLNPKKKLQNNSEKKSMIITLQKENGQIILRKEAKIRKSKDKTNPDPKIGMVSLEKESAMKSNRSVLNSKHVIAKHNQVALDSKKLMTKISPDGNFKLSQHVIPESKQGPLCVNTVHKKVSSGPSFPKKLKTQSKKEDLNVSEIIKQCPVQSTEIAVNWLMKKFPLVDIRYCNDGFHARHPYCAKDREMFLNWPLAKQRAAEWMRAKTIGKIVNEMPNLEKWTTVEILYWAKLRCYTPTKNDAEYDGPIFEHPVDFVYQPKNDGLSELVNKHKIQAEEEEIDVITVSANKQTVICSAGTEHIPNETDTLSLFDPKFQGYKQFISKCMMNSAGKKPECELLVDGVAYPAVEQVLTVVFSSLAEELIRRSHNASWIRHGNRPPRDISINDVKEAVLSRSEFDFLLPYADSKGRLQPPIISFFR